jgi:hypothetical protein
VNPFIQNKVRSRNRLSKKCEKYAHGVKEDNRLSKLGLIQETLKCILVPPLLNKKQNVLKEN